MVNETVVDALTIANVKAVAEAGAISQNIATANLVAHQGRLQLIGEAALGANIKRLTETDISEAGGLATILQQAGKVAQTTPPVTP